MATTIVTPTRTVVTTTAVCGCSVEQTELIARAECYLRLEEQSENLMLALTKRRDDEQAKIFKTLCGTTELTMAKLTEVWKPFDTLTAAIEVESAIVTKFQASLSASLVQFTHSHPEVLRRALESKRKNLCESLSKERLDTIEVEKRIALVEKRLGELTPAAAIMAEAAVVQTTQQHQQTTSEKNPKKA